LALTVFLAGFLIGLVGVISSSELSSSSSDDDDDDDDDTSTFSLDFCFALPEPTIKCHG